MPKELNPDELSNRSLSHRKGTYNPGGGKTPKPAKRLKNNKDIVTPKTLEAIVGLNAKDVKHIKPTKKELEEIKNKPLKGVVLLSGGLDSLAALDKAILDGWEMHALTINYGASNSKREVASAKKIAKHYGVPHQIIDINWPWWKGGLTADKPEIEFEEQPENGLGKEYVPARNTLFLSIAYAYAETMDMDGIFVGFAEAALPKEHESLGKMNFLPDTSPLFLTAMQIVINTTTIKDSGFTIGIYAPFHRLSKVDTIKYCKERNVPIHLSWSCFKAEDKPCGTCAVCVMRKLAFEIAEIKDTGVNE